MHVLAHPSIPSQRIRVHPSSPLADLPLESELHYVSGSWTEEERAAHPEWTWDLTILDDKANASHTCADRCGSNTQESKVSILDCIAYIHGSAAWDNYWTVTPQFSVNDSCLLDDLNDQQVSLVNTGLNKIKRVYQSMDAVGYFKQVADLYRKALSAPHAPPRPKIVFGAGLSGYDRLDERGFDRARYTSTSGHSENDWERRTGYQIAYLLGLSRIFELPAGHTIAYDPCYSVVDLVILASLGIRAIRKSDPGRKFLRMFTVPTLFYAPGAEQSTIADMVLRTPNIANLLIECGDVSWCEHYAHVQLFATHCAAAQIPPFKVQLKQEEKEEAPCGEEHLLQWIPPDNVEGFHRGRGPAREL
ncbi:SRR1 domain-containing protein [Mycena kentingensis (nom. inval.)]|nr:SRR1 domain-containing protein [Mycena kentingensis (nom. inval.)]